MLGNNNDRVIRRLAEKSVRNNRNRSLILAAAVALASFMLFSVFTVGLTWLDMYQLQNVRLNGGEFDAVLYGITDGQYEKCMSDKDVLLAGTVGIAGSIEKTETDGTVGAGCIWADPVFWDEIMAPAREWVRGDYPQTEDQVMISEKGLKSAGLEGLDVGDTFSAEYRDSEGNLSWKTFSISGIWKGYGDGGEFYVSEAFYRQSGYELSEVASGRLYLDLKPGIMTSDQQQTFTDSLDLGKQQALFFTGDMGYSVPIFLGLAGIAMVTCLCAYLLIYNIMNLSVAGNVRYYGLLQSVGMTERQIRSLIRRQMCMLGGGGLAAGLLLGGAVSFLLFPSVIRSLGIRSSEVGTIEIVFHPAVFILTAAFTALTIYAGSRKPVKKAVSVSPVEATGYRGTYDRSGYRKTRRGKIFPRMALEQLTRDKKRSTVIMASLAAGMSVFLCLVTLLESEGARSYVYIYRDADMALTNDTLNMDEKDGWKQLMDGDFLEKAEAVEGVREADPLLCAEVMVPWEPDFVEKWLEEFFAMWMYAPYEDYREKYQEHPEDYSTFLIGINESDFDYMQENMDIAVNKEDFLAGKTCVLYRNSLDFTSEQLKGTEVTCALPDDPGETRTFTIAGLTDENYYSGAGSIFPPVIIVSDQVMRDYIADPYVAKLSLFYDETYDEAAEQELISLMESSPDANDFSCSSRLEAKENVEKAQGNMMEVGIGIALILALIGLMNYINTVTGNIQNRQNELAVLESIGMTDRQRNRMLIMEGLFFAIGSLALTGTIGLGVTYVIYQALNYMGAPFMVPLWPMVGMAALVTAVCILIPLAAGSRMARRGSVVERLRESGQ